MRAIIAFVLAALCLTSAASAAGAPKGSYCGSYMFFIKGRITIVSSTELDFELDVGGKKTTCNKEKYLVDPKGAMTLPDTNNKGDCIGDLIKSNDLETLKIDYDAGSNKIHLDAGVGSVNLKSC